MTTEIRLFQSSDWPDVSRIYEQGLLTRNATFETEMPSYDQWIKKFHTHLLWVIVVKSKVAGWLGLQPVSNRKVYEGVVEVSVYIDEAHRGMSLGKQLMRHMISQSEDAGIWTLYASIFPENTSSIQLHTSSGFREIGYRERIGMLEGQWRSTLLFERRSRAVGL